MFVFQSEAGKDGDFRGQRNTVPHKSHRRTETHRNNTRRYCGEILWKRELANEGDLGSVQMAAIRMQVLSIDLERSKSLTKGKNTLSHCVIPSEQGYIFYSLDITLLASKKA